MAQTKSTELRRHPYKVLFQKTAFRCPYLIDNFWTFFRFLHPVSGDDFVEKLFAGIDAGIGNSAKREKFPENDSERPDIRLEDKQECLALLSLTLA